MGTPRTIVMIANSDTAVNGFLALVERLEKFEDLKSLIVCHKRVHLDAALKRCTVSAEKATLIYFDTLVACPQKIDNKYGFKRCIQKIPVINAIFGLADIVINNIRGLFKAKRLIKKERPVVILLYADNKAEFEQYFIYWAKKDKIETIIAPICYASIDGILSNPTNGFRIDINDKLPLSAKCIRKINPKEERIYDNQRIFFDQPFSCIVNWFMGMKIPNPWVQGSLADMVCTAYQKEYEEILEELGENAKERVYLTASLEDSAIIESYRNRLNVKRNLKDKYKLTSDIIVIIAFSERMERVSKENDLYNKEIIVKSILKYYKEVLVSLHPRSNVEENVFLMEHKGCYIVDLPLRKIVGAADLLVYGDVSSVGRWSEMLGINKVVWKSYSMEEKWQKDQIEELQRSLEDSTRRKKKQKEADLKYEMDFLNILMHEM